MKNPALKIGKIAVLVLSFIIFAGVSAYLTLTLLIKSEDIVVVPDLTGKEVVNVLEILTDLGLNTKVKGFEYTENVPKNHIVFQQPKPGVEIKKGRDIKIVISKGAKNILMPNLKGLSLQQARIIIEENGLCHKEQSRTYNSVFEKDNIIAQVPPPGSQINRGECVNLLLSLGIRPRAYKMPMLNGLTLDKAIGVIEKSNLTLGEIKSLFLEDKPEDTITNQDPLAGSLVYEGRSVTLVLNRKPGLLSSAYLAGTKNGNFFRYRTTNGFLKRHIRVYLTGLNFSNDVLDEFVRPGEEIWLLVPNEKDAMLLFYEDDDLVAIKEIQ
ncbi:MAG: PASTA domain-containing protein [Deltaproteobacteria bacterium]|nr:PASTA domain-containing protein [Deltaproteobacteria bacterium]